MPAKHHYFLLRSFFGLWRASGRKGKQNFWKTRDANKKSNFPHFWAVESQIYGISKINSKIKSIPKTDYYVCYTPRIPIGTHYAKEKEVEGGIIYQSTLKKKEKKNVEKREKKRKK